MILWGTLSATLCIGFWTVLIVPHSGHATGFTNQPASVVQAEGLEAVFECLHPGASSYGWALNGSFLLDLPPGVETDSRINGYPVRLIITATPQYNNTVVQCEAVVREGGVLMGVLSENVVLRVQGPLLPVTNLRFLSEQLSSTTITISWEAPFSLDLTTAEPDIQYCVDVYNVTGGGDDHLQSVCDITDTHYMLTASDPDQLFNLTVTPRSNVEGSLNGTTSQPVQGSILGEPAVINTNEIKIISRAGPEKVILEIMIPKLLLKSPGRVPTHYNIEVSCDSGLAINYFRLAMNDTVTKNNSLTISVEIEKHYNCNLTMLAENSAGSTSYTPSVNISTYDVQEVYANYSKKQVDIGCTFLTGTKDPGFFVIILSPKNSSPVYCAARREQLNPTNVSVWGQFESPMVVVYDLQETSGLPEKRPTKIVSAVSSSVSGSNNVLQNSGESSIESIFITFSNGEICMNCSFSAPELTGCVGVIHSAQLKNFTLTVLTVGRSGERECTKDIEEGDHNVAVFGWSGEILDEEPILQGNISSGKPLEFARPPAGDASTSSAVAAVIPAVVVAVIIQMAVLVLVVRLRRRKRVDSVYVGGEESPPRYEDLPLNKSHTGYENVALTTLTRTGTELQQQEHNSQTQVELQLQQESGGSSRERFAPKTVNQEAGVLYAHLNVKSDNDQPSVDPATVQYASIDKQKLAPVSGESQNSIEQVAPAPPSPPPPPTPETVLSELHPIAEKWEELGEALGVPEHILDNISMEGNDQVRLHEMIQYYLQFPHSWEEIVRALEEIGETEAADKIVRTKSLEVSPPVTFSNDSPPLPPRNGADDKFSGSVPESNSTSGEDIIGLNLPGANSKSQEEDGRKISNKSGPVTCDQNVFRSHVYEKEVQHCEQCRPQVEDANETQHSCLQETEFPPPCVQETEESSPAHEWSSRSYYSSLAHSLDLYWSFNAPERFKARAIRTLTCGTNDLIHPNNTVQQWMEGLKSEESTANYNCHVVEELSNEQESDMDDIIHNNNNNSYNLSTRSDLISKNNSYTKHSVPEKFQCQSIFKVAAKNTPVTGGSSVNRSQPPGDHKLPTQEADSETSVLTEPEGTPLVLAPLTMSAQCGDGGGEDSSPWETLVESAKQDGVSDQQWVDKSTEKKTSPLNCFFIETFHPPEHCFPSKGIQLREHGYIFQPGDGEEFLGVSGDGWGNGGRILLPDTSWVKREELRFFEHLHTHMCPTELASPIHDQLKSLSSTGSDKVNLDEIGSAPMQMKITSLGCWDVRLAAAAETLD